MKKPENPIPSPPTSFERSWAPYLSNYSKTTWFCKTYTPSSPSEGTYTQDLTRQSLNLKEPKLRENLKFTGESRLLWQFLLDIYDTLEQFASKSEHEKRKINLRGSHFTSTNVQLPPAQAWLLALLMKNAHTRGIVDTYANLKYLDYVLLPICLTDAFIKELIAVFGDKNSSRKARQDLAKCKHGNY